jgi:hypothetical protein
MLDQLAAIHARQGIDLLHRNVLSPAGNAAAFIDVDVLRNAEHPAVDPRAGHEEMAARKRVRPWPA